MSQPIAEYTLLDVFTDRAFAGNPLAVFPQAVGGAGSGKRGGRPRHWQIIKRIEMGGPSRIFAEAERDGHDLTLRIAG